MPADPKADEWRAAYEAWCMKSWRMPPQHDESFEASTFHAGYLAASARADAAIADAEEKVRRVVEALEPFAGAASGVDKLSDHRNVILREFNRSPLTDRTSHVSLKAGDFRRAASVLAEMKGEG